MRTTGTVILSLGLLVGFWNAAKVIWWVMYSNMPVEQPNAWDIYWNGVCLGLSGFAFLGGILLYGFGSVLTALVRSQPAEMRPSSPAPLPSPRTATFRHVPIQTDTAGKDSPGFLR